MLLNKIFDIGTVICPKARRANNTYWPRSNSDITYWTAYLKYQSIIE